MTQLKFRNMRNSECNSPNLVHNPMGTWVNFLWPILDNSYDVTQIAEAVYFTENLINKARSFYNESCFVQRTFVECKNVSIKIYKSLNCFICEPWCHENGINYLIKKFI